MPTSLSPLTGRTIRCLLFDLGSTLWTYRDDAILRQAAHNAEQRAITILRRHLHEQDAARLDTLQPEQLTQAIYAQAQQENIPGQYNEPDMALATVAAVRQLGFPNIDPSVGEEMFEATRLRIPETRVFFEDALPTLATLKERGFLLSIVTNRGHGGEIFQEDVHTLGLFEYIDPHNMAVSIDLKIRKPDPRIFQYALDALEVQANEAVMVGDMLGADVYGSKQLGMYSVWKPHPEVFAQARAEQQDKTPSLNTLKHIALHRMRYHLPDRATLEALEPDMVIEHLKELLDVFTKVGKQ